MTITNKYTTYRTTGYTHQVGDNPMATGGVHHHQIRKGVGGYKYRICESNGRHTAYSHSSVATEVQVSAAKASAE